MWDSIRQGVDMRSIGGWILDQAFEFVGILAEAKRRRLLKQQQRTRWS